jgi:hypothetical protein
VATGRGDDRFLVAVGVLSLLAEVAEAAPLLCVVDDAQGLDQASADALTFTARRLEAEGVVLLFATSDSDVRRFQAPGLPELRVGGLDDEARQGATHRAIAFPAVALGTRPPCCERGREPARPA